MREILSKGKRMDNNEWVKGFFIIEEYSSLKDVRPAIIPVIENGSGLWGEKNESDYDTYEIDPETFCQYTGLLDKNGKKIWENDICIIHSSHIDEEDGYFIIKWDDDKARYILDGVGLSVDFDNFYAYECEVVGNVFDDPELLKTEAV